MKLTDRGISIFQPFHDDVSRQFVDPDAIAFDWRSNPTPELREAAIYLHLDSELEAISTRLIGVFSPKFAVKSLASLGKFADFIEANPGHDIYFVNPFPEIPYCAFNVWDQGEVSHPGLMGIAHQSFERSRLLPYTSFDLRNDQTTACYCNFWVATPAFFRHYVRCLRELISDTKLTTTLTSHDFSPAPFFPFVAERLFSSLITSSNAFSHCGYRFSKEEIIESAGPKHGRPFVLGNIEYVDRLDREKSWTSQDRLRLFDGSVAVALAAARDLENSPQFDLRIWEKHLSDLKSGHRPARTV